MKQRINTTVDEAAAQWLRDTASLYRFPLGSVIADLVRTQGARLHLIYDRQLKRNLDPGADAREGRAQ